uniref:Uncharacterized protein n=1 Tax=Timema monikensis TaxID=170555 RepID=A0A7R9HQU8_9NEOP|nr:unnamed protein product [Timema monikensis]
MEGSKSSRHWPEQVIIYWMEGLEHSGLRVAHSAYGIVTSLSGEPEENIVVEAVGLDSCAHFQEESTTDEKGYFRIRGLQPQGQGHLGEPDLTLKKAAEFCRAAEVSRLQVKALQEKSVESVKRLRTALTRHTVTGGGNDLGSMRHRGPLTTASLRMRSLNG